MVNSGNTDLASILGTNELVKQNNFTSNINNKDSYVYEELKYDSFCYIHLSCFQHIVSGPIYFSIVIFSYFSIIWNLVLYPVQKTNWWFMIWPPEFVSIVDGSYCQPFCSDFHVLRLGVNVVCQLSAILLRPSCTCIKVWCLCTGSRPISAVLLKLSCDKVWCNFFFLQKTGTQIFSYSFIECNVEHLIRIQ